MSNLMRSLLDSFTFCTRSISRMSVMLLGRSRTGLEDAASGAARPAPRSNPRVLLLISTRHHYRQHDHRSRNDPAGPRRQFSFHPRLLRPGRSKPTLANPQRARVTILPRLSSTPAIYHEKDRIPGLSLATVVCLTPTDTAPSCPAGRGGRGRRRSR